MERDKDKSRLTAAVEERRFEEVRSRVRRAVLNAAKPAAPPLRSVHEADQPLDSTANNQRMTECSADFLGNMSHELRSPLCAIIGFSEVLLDQLYGPINEKQQHYVNNILSSGLHLLTVINDILDLSSAEPVTLDLELSRFSLRESLEASVLLHREEAFRKELTLNMDLVPAADVQIVADQVKLKRVMFTLLSNAIKYTPAAGTVSVSAMRQGDSIEITVADTGMGIKVEDISKLFQVPPQNTETVDTGKDEAKVADLVLIRQLVELHGGRIWVKSYFGIGSRFSFSLPLPLAETAETPAHREEIILGAGKTVLLIEDEELTLAATEHALHEKGYRILRAKDGEDGIAMAQRYSPDLIVLDLILPGINGFDVVERLCSEKIAETVPILILTSMKIRSADRARLAGKVWKIVAKGSLSTHELINLVETAVSSNQTFLPKG